MLSLPLSYRCWLPSSAAPPASWLVLCWQCCCQPLECRVGFSDTLRKKTRRKNASEVRSCRMRKFIRTEGSQKSGWSQAWLIQPSPSSVQLCLRLSGGQNMEFAFPAALTFYPFILTQGQKMKSVTKSVLIRCAVTLVKQVINMIIVYKITSK